jgi:hypothetical protein
VLPLGLVGFSWVPGSPIDIGAAAGQLRESMMLCAS